MAVADPLGAFLHPLVEREGRADGPLGGLRFAAKDIFDIAGERTGCGNPDWLRTHPPAATDAWAVARLMDAGAHVVPVLTKGATRFVGRATFDALASERTQMSLFDEDDPIPHTTLGQTADCVVVAPATARVIGAYAAGISSDLLTATLIATRAPVVICPAMHTEMWEHPAVVHNIATLVERGVHVVGPESGRLAEATRAPGGSVRRPTLWLR